MQTLTGLIGKVSKIVADQKIKKKKTVYRCRFICFFTHFFAYYNNGRLLLTRVPKLQALVYDILASRKMPESDARSV